MNRPALPTAISSIAAADLPFTEFDGAELSDTIARLLEIFDRAEAGAAHAPTTAFAQVSTCSHANPGPQSTLRSREFASA